MVSLLARGLYYSGYLLTKSHSTWCNVDFVELRDIYSQSQ